MPLGAWGPQDIHHSWFMLFRLEVQGLGFEVLRLRVAEALQLHV